MGFLVKKVQVADFSILSNHIQYLEEVDCPNQVIIPTSIGKLYLL